MVKICLGDHDGFILHNIHDDISPGHNELTWRLMLFKFNITDHCIQLSNEASRQTIRLNSQNTSYTVYPKKYAHGFVVLCFVVVMQSFIMNSHEVFIHIHQGCFAGTGAIVRLPQCQWSKPDGLWENQSMYNHNKAQQSKNRVHISWDILYLEFNIMKSE